MSIVVLGILAWWSGYYGNHDVASVSIRFLHLTGLILGGGTGLVADRQILHAARAGHEEKQRMLEVLNQAHAHVIPWIIVIGLTGILMTTADLSTFLVSKVFWFKMALVALLVCNGMFLLFLETRARRFGAAAVWPRVVFASTVSAVLWLSILLVGTALTVAA